jgi:hypothetical protein
MCNAYRGVFTDIPKLKYMSSVSIVSKSIRYPGRFMGKLIVLPKGEEERERAGKFATFIITIN